MVEQTFTNNLRDPRADDRKIRFMNSITPSPLLTFF